MDFTRHQTNHGPEPQPQPEASATPHHMPAPTAPVTSGAQPSLAQPTDSLRPVPVVKVLSPVGIEYVFMTVTLLLASLALAGTLLALVNGGANFLSLAFPTASMVVTVPVFAWLFLRLKRLEARTPELRLDASRRRSTQFTQIFNFLVCLFTLVGFVYAIFASLGGLTEVSIGKAALDALSVLVVFGGVLFYYWREEHRKGGAGIGAGR